MDGYANSGYFDAKRELKKIYNLGQKAIQRKDDKYINFLLLNLDELENALKTFNIDAFGLHILKKDISGMRHFLTTKFKKKKAEDAAHEKKSRRSSK
jgi:hypothetical protein